MDGFDEIHIDGLEMDVAIGFSAHEQGVLQRVVVDLVVYVEARDYEDDPATILDYRALKNEIRAVVPQQRFLLLESMCQAIARICLAHARKVTVTGHKPGALTGAADVSVRMTRHA